MEEEGEGEYLTPSCSRVVNRESSGKTIALSSTAITTRSSARLALICKCKRMLEMTRAMMTCLDPPHLCKVNATSCVCYAVLKS
jgi:hypothetical protein